ncbi:MAG: NAD-dependent epimerase/dehydratase family protein [Candidatus Binataceae bacterium]
MANDNMKVVAIAGGSGFIGGAIARRLAGIPAIRARLLSRNPERARERLAPIDADFVRAEVTDPSSLKTALDGARAIVSAVQFDGYPVEDPSRGLTFERVDYGGTVAILEAAKACAVEHFIYISGVAADERSSHPAFSAKGRAERAIRESGLSYTIFRPSLVFGPGDSTVNMFARMLRFAPLFAVPGTGRQRLQPVYVEDLAACVALALTDSQRARNQIFEVGGPEPMTFDELIRIVMDVTGRHRPIIHIPEVVMRAAGFIAEKLPRPRFSRDAVAFVTADHVCDIAPLVEKLGIQLTPAREAMAYLAPKP